MNRAIWKHFTFQAGPGLLLALIVLVTFLPFLVRLDLVLAPRSGLGTDLGVVHWSRLLGYARALREQGQMPVWDDSTALGRPLAGDPDALWLYPFDLVFLVVPPAAAFSILAVAHVFLAGLLAMWFCREGLQTLRGAALMGGLAFMLTPKFIAHLAAGHVGIAYSFTWLPLVMLGTNLMAYGQRRGAIMAGLGLALQLPAHVQIWFFTLVLMSVYFLWLWLPRVAAVFRAKRRDWRPAVTRAGLFVLAVAVFAGLCALVLLPFLGLLPLSSRAAFTAQDAAW